MGFFSSLKSPTTKDAKGETLKVDDPVTLTRSFRGKYRELKEGQRERIFEISGSTIYITKPGSHPEAVSSGDIEKATPQRR